MKHQKATVALLVSIALFATIVAGDTTTAASEPLTGSETERGKDQAQTNLQTDPILQEQIDQTKAFLDDRESEVSGQISRLKTEGLIDRRSATNIKSALEDARGSMTGMAEGMQSKRQFDGWTARMIAYELGMAADTLAQQADKIETQLGTTPESPAEPQDGNSATPDQRRDLIETLRETSSLLHKAARAITSNVK